jgi:pimeloyl-ACP methyl ester carboxylesterase
MVRQGGVRTWLFLRGWAREARHWGDFPEQFRAAMHDAQVVALDLPGNGRFCDRQSPFSVDAMVEHSREWLGAQGTLQPYHLLGLSLGGVVSLDWASRHPDEVAACVVLNTSLRPFSAFYERIRPRNYATLLRVLAERDPRARETAIFRLTSSRELEPDTVSAWTRYATERPVSRGNALRQLVAAARYRAPADAPKVPVLVLAGAGDRLVDPRCSESLARRWNAPLAVHRDAGHDLTLDDGPWVAAEVKRWLRPS